MQGIWLISFGFIGAATGALWSFHVGQAWEQVFLAYSLGGTLAMTIGMASSMLIRLDD